MKTVSSVYHFLQGNIDQCKEEQERLCASLHTDKGYVITEHYLLGLTYEAKGDLAAALKNYEHVLRYGQEASFLFQYAKQKLETLSAARKED